MNEPNETLPGGGPKRPPPAAPQPSGPEGQGQTAPHPRPAVPPPSGPAPVPPAARPPAAPPPVNIGGSVGGDVAGGDLNKELNAGRDIVGRDVVTNTTTTNVGFTADTVQRLLLSVGALVAATAACFFLLGSATAVAVVVAFNRPVNSNNLAAAQSFDAELAALRALPPGQPYEFSFSEEEISSYVHVILEPTLNGEITNAQVRLLDARQLALSGQARRLLGLQFAATFEWQKDVPGAPLKLTGALLHVLPLGDSPLGWVPLPLQALRPLETMLNSLFGNVAIVDVKPLPPGPQLPLGHAWDVTVVGH